jgi:hypothetical protein
MTVEEPFMADQPTQAKNKKPPLLTALITTTLIDWQATKTGGSPKNHHEDIF